MNNVSDILKLAEQTRNENIDAVLATVVHTEGSAYRKAGAMMLICADGRSAGMISGGCLEPHIIKKAFWLTRNGSVVQVYQTGDETNSNAASYKGYDHSDSLNDVYYDELEMNFGLGCNGKIHVLFERMDYAFGLIKTLQQVRQTAQPVTIATLVRSEVSNYPIGLHVNLNHLANLKSTRPNELACSDLVYLNKDIELNNEDPILTQALNVLSEEYSLNSQLELNSQLVGHQLASESSKFVTLQGVLDNDINQRIQTQWLVHYLRPQIKLLICGAGNDVIPLVTLAKMQDWQVTVIDSRSHYATRARFMQADKVLCLPLDDEETLKELSRNSAVAIMSHSLTQDRARLKVLLANPPLYLGQLGPKYRTERLIDEIVQENPKDADKYKQGIDNLYYPIGYNLGGDGPEALALGIMAQISEVMYGKESCINNHSNSNNSKTINPKKAPHLSTDAKAILSNPSLTA
ncbi:XdhC/CoxI family protein [Psychrobacter sp.]|uniref:XdhC family protein n=1 Tax=Psychrobacter sp. TaxID=56811 RepID=UPI0025D79DB9|nr:XdhC/CoxI family protein [Psychrobacter sp.]